MKPIRFSWSSRSGRALVLQAALLIVLLVAGWALWRNTAHNLAARGIRSGFAFLDQRAGFDIGEGVVPYTPDSTFLRAFADPDHPAGARPEWGVPGAEPLPEGRPR